MADGDLDMDDVVMALKELLREGVEYAVKTASKAGGFLNNLDIRIPWPESLRGVKRKLERAGFDERIESFVERLNTAAEAAGTRV